MIRRLESRRVPTLMSLWAVLLAVLAGAPALAEETYLSISEDDCARLARHYPADDVTYQPGRDVNGKPVVPADLNGGNSLVLPKAVVIPIEVDLFQRYGIPSNSANFKGDVFIGEVVVDVATGRATFNGQPLQSDDEAELAARCQQILKDRKAGN